MFVQLLHTLVNFEDIPMNIKVYKGLRYYYAHIYIYMHVYGQSIEPMQLQRIYNSLDHTNVKYRISMDILQDF
jgi:hypothetical protein